MRLNTIKPAEGSKKDARRVGRGIGSTLGKTCGRGHKGQYARTGKGKVKAGFEGGQMPLQRRLPKVGFRSRTAASAGEVFLYQLAQLKGDVVDIDALRAAGLIATGISRVKLVKQGEIARAMTVRGVACTEGARAAILAAGGSVE
ncbi:MAG: 50S ribosomal protein L15 [Xanthomonadales bacterium]|nr:50S ribosomal protein L15 [Xanthomonadales bacterium]MCC6591939.1 50S ribosomal protein L15 [Xanthomonadales bacterium]MCE7930442.1 50S ribosomal protein L15 [Xanthomonadales bacterium PRO6]